MVSRVYISYVVSLLLGLAFAGPGCFRCSKKTLGTPLEAQFFIDSKRGMPYARVKAVEKKLSADGTRIKYHLYVEQIYANCVEELPRIQLLYTSADACGVQLEPDRMYILPLRKDGRSTKLSRCHKVIAVDELTNRQERFLNTRSFFTCEGRLTCAWGQMPYACSHVLGRRPVRPCQRAKRWYINECDGCVAEWLTWSGLPACTDTKGRFVLAPKVSSAITRAANSYARRKEAESDALATDDIGFEDDAILAVQKRGDKNKLGVKKPTKAKSNVGKGSKNNSSMEKEKSKNVKNHAKQSNSKTPSGKTSKSGSIGSKNTNSAPRKPTTKSNYAQPAKSKTNTQSEKPKNGAKKEEQGKKASGGKKKIEQKRPAPKVPSSVGRKIGSPGATRK